MQRNEQMKARTKEISTTLYEKYHYFPPLTKSQVGLEDIM